MEVKIFIERIQSFASATPDKVMFVDENATRQTTYAEFLSLTQKIAALVNERLQGQERIFVPIFLPDSMEYFASEIAIWMTGNAAVHMGTSFPQERVDYIMEHCEAEFMIDDEFIEEARQSNKKYTDIRPRTADQPCAMFYTSGSTGNPKGVLHCDAGFMHSITRFDEGFSLKGYKKFASTASCYFVVLVTTYSMMIEGSELHILAPEVRRDVHLLEDYIAEHEIEFANISPSLLRVYQNKSKSLKVIKGGGERLVGCYTEDYTVLNTFGQTETAGPVFIKPLDKDYDNAPIGKPTPGVEIVLLDDEGNEVPDGEVGELCFKSGMHSPIYFKDPERTEALTAGGVQHTSDLVKRLPNGDILYVQRKDWMVKINGLRVEPGEVETVMRHISGVKDAIVKGFTTEDLTRQYLVGYYILEEGSALNADVIKEELGKKVPAYMVPQYMVQMEAFPLNANNKIDRKSLLPPDLTSMQSEYVAPTNDVEAALCDAFAKVLKLERVGIDDDFFLLGGDSIRVMQLQQHLDLKKITTMVNSGRTPRKIAEQYAALGKATSAGVVENGMYPLTDIQNTYLDICLPLEGLPVLNLTNLIKLDDKVDLDRLAESICKSLEYHPAMFVRFHRATDGSIVQNIQKEPYCVEIEHLTDEDFEALKPKLVKAFRYFEDRLFQFRLFKTPSAQYMFHNIHHSIFDGESKSIFFADIEKAYSGHDIEKERDSYLNIALEENAMHGTDYYEAARNGFRNMFKDCPRTLYVENAGSNYLQSKLITLGVKASEAMEFCSENHTTMNTLTTAAFVMLLGTETDSRDVVFGSQFSGRTDASVSNMVGSFAKPLFMRCTWGKETNTTDFLRNVGGAINQSIANSIYSLSEIMEDNLVDSQLQFVYQDQISMEPVIGGFPTKAVDFQRNQTPSTLVVNIFRNIAEDKLVMLIAYREDIFSSEKIDSMLKTYDENMQKLMTKC